MNVRPDMFLWAEMKKHFEGCELEAYPDSGKVWTIGFGETYNHDAKRKVQKGDKINFDTAVKWLEVSAKERIDQANQYIKVPLSAHQSVAICDYIYNRGIGNFLKTQIDDMINAGASVDRICNEIVNTGLKDRLGNLLWGLGRRRRSQAYMYKYGKLKFDFPRWGQWDI
jgi:GH24 family phage-related lysozyme (muramidase)